MKCDGQLLMRKRQRLKGGWRVGWYCEVRAKLLIHKGPIGAQHAAVSSLVVVVYR